MGNAQQNEHQPHEAIVHPRTKKKYHQCILEPGYIVVSEEPALLCAVCASGVVLVVWDRFKRVGGMAYCIYAKCRKGKRKPTNHYADVAVPQLVRQMVLARAHPVHIEAQLFGAGSPRGYSGVKAKRVVQVMKKKLKDFQIEIVSEDLRGSIGRKVMLDTHSGDVITIKTRRVRKADWHPEYLLQQQTGL